MSKTKLLLAMLLFIGTSGYLIAFGGSSVSAATLTVESANDNTTSDGNCTYREALINLNDQANTYVDCMGVGVYGSEDTINFEITTGGTPFTNQGQTGYTISFATNTPDVDVPVIIDGYTQDNSIANTSPAPEPFNGRLLVEFDGSAIDVDTNAFNITADNVEVRGLVINGFDTTGAFGIGGSNAVIQGNYIGTNYQGTAQASTQLSFGVSRNGFDPVSGVLIGGLDPEDRNLFGGIKQSAITPDLDAHNWIIQGNYVGVDVTGLNAIPNVTDTVAGALSLDNSSGHIVGGSEPTAINVISGNHGKGIAPNGTDDTRIEGNYIGVGHDGTTPLPNEKDGISYSGGNSEIVIKDNIVSYNENTGIYLAEDPLNATIVGNTIMHNDLSGILIVDSSDITIGGGAPTQRNVISGNGSGNVAHHNISIVGGPVGSASNISIQGNYIGTDVNGNIKNSLAQNQHHGVSITRSVNNVIIGGDDTGEGNIIAGSGGPGVSIQEDYIPSLGGGLSPTNISIVGNSIYSSSDGSIQGFGTSGIGIELYSLILDGGFVPQFLESDGPTLNDLTDSDTGPNEYINFPVLGNAVQDGTDLSLTLDLDAAGTDDGNGEYRVEIFASDEADASGYGEGQTYLGYVNIANGENQEASITLPSGTDLTGKLLSATTTAISDSTDSGFGGTSEFSAVAGVSVIAAAEDDDSSGNDTDGDSGSLAETGRNVLLITLATSAIFTVSVVLIRRRIRV